MYSLDRKLFYKDLVALAIPIAIQNLLVALIGATDALMLGRLSQASVAAVSLANQIAFIMSLFIYSVIGSGGVLISQYWGKGDRRMVQNIFCTTAKGAFAVTFIFFLLTFFAPEFLMRIYTPERNLIEIGASYLRIVGFSYLFTGVTQAFYTMMKVENAAAKSVTISVVTLIADVVLDFFLIYGHAGFPALGPNGSAYSTIGVEAIAFIWVVAESYKPDRIRLDWAGLRWHSKAITKDMIKIALPMLGSGLAWGVGFSMQSMIMGHMGSDATAASSIASVAHEIITCVGKGVSTGCGIMIGKLLGQDLFEEAKSYGKEFWRVSFWVGILSVVLLLIAGPIVVMFFVLTETAKRYLVCMILFNMLYAFAFCYNTIITCGVFPAGGDAHYDTISVLISMWCFAIPLALLGAFVFHWPVITVFIIMRLDEIVKVPWIYPRYQKFIWLKNLTREENE